jgi:hypothetical protein
MKKAKFLWVLGLLFATLPFWGCDNVVQQQNRNILGQFTETPVTITWSGSREAGVQSFQANVHVFVKNNRTDTHAVLAGMHRIAVSTIDNRIVTRVDFDELQYSSILSDGEQALVLDPISGAITHRVQLPEANSPLNRMFANQSVMSRINLSLMREEAHRLSLSLTEEGQGDSMRLLLDIPPHLIPQNGVDRIISSRAVFDLANETLMETEVVMIREDGTFVTTTANPIYEDQDGIPVKIGMVTVIDSRAPHLIEDIYPSMNFFESMEDIPLISEGQFSQMMSEGNAHEVPNMIFGNPADLSFVETIFEVYYDIQINSAPEHLFRAILR